MKTIDQITGLMLTMLLVGAVAIPARAVEDNLKFSGTLVGEPCELSSPDIDVEFDPINRVSFYEQPRMAAKPFVISLINCDTALANSVSVTFKGSEDTALPGLLAVVSSTVTGVAIGLETSTGVAIPLNQATDSYSLNTGSNQLAFQAYVQAEPDAITNKTITAGDFSANATFELSYP